MTWWIRLELGNHTMALLPNSDTTPTNNDFTKGIWAHDSNLLALIFILMAQLGNNVARVKTAQLSWCVWKCVLMEVIMLLYTVSWWRHPVNSRPLLRLHSAVSLLWRVFFYFLAMGDQQTKRWGSVTHLCVIELDYHLFRYWCVKEPLLTYCKWGGTDLHQIKSM